MFSAAPVRLDESALSHPVEDLSAICSIGPVTLIRRGSGPRRSAWASCLTDRRPANFRVERALGCAGWIRSLSGSRLLTPTCSITSRLKQAPTIAGVSSHCTEQSQRDQWVLLLPRDRLVPGGTLQPFVVDERCRRIISIDPRPPLTPDDRPGSPTWAYRDNSTERMLELLGAIPGADVEDPDDHASTEDIAPGQFARPDFCFIDGEHTRGAVLRDARFCRAVLQGAGVIAFHDFQIVEPGIAHSLGEIPGPMRAYLLRRGVFVIQLGTGRSLLDDARLAGQLRRSRAFWRGINGAHAVRLLPGPPAQTTRATHALSPDQPNAFYSATRTRYRWLAGRCGRGRLTALWYKASSTLAAVVPKGDATDQTERDGRARLPVQLETTGAEHAATVPDRSSHRRRSRA